MSRNVVLVGPMGSGKSTVGRVLARRLGLRHVDTDDLVVRGARRSIPEIFAADGEAGFRERETAALTLALGDSGVVVSTGGGIVATGDNRAMIEAADAFVVWLDGTVDALAERVGAGRGRPMLAGDVRETLREKVAEREPGYAAVADVRIDTSAMDHADCVTAIVAAIDGVPT